MREIPQIAVDFVARWEKCRLLAYQDSAGIWTLGYGHIDGVQKGDRCTKAQALLWLAEGMRGARLKLDAVLKPAVIDCLTEHQWAALLSFVFNLGAKKSWTIWKRVNARQFDQVPGQLILFVNAEDPKTGKLVRVQGLVNRRADEIKLWSTAEPGAVTVAPPSAVTSVGNTPPTPADPVAPSKSATLLIGGLAAASSAAPMVDQARGLIAPYADHSPIVEKMLGILATVGAILAIAGLVLIYLKKREHRS